MSRSDRSAEVTPRVVFADALAVALCVLTMGLHVRFGVLDPRPPADLGHYYWPMRQIVEQLQHDASMPWREVDTPYTVILAAIVFVTGTSAHLMHVVDGGWLALLLYGVWRSARVSAGSWAGLVAVALVGAFPQTHAIARMHWIHHPESAAAVGALGTALGVERWRLGRAVGVAMLLAFAMTVRETGVAFGGIVALAILAAGWRTMPRAAMAIVVTGVVAALAWQAPGFVSYVGKKAAGAAGYAEAVGSPWPVFLNDLGWPALVVAVPLAIVGALGVVGAGRAVIAVALVWVMGGVVATLLFHVGPDNFPLCALGLAIVAGVGVAMISAMAVRSGRRWQTGAVHALALSTVVMSASLQCSQLIDEDMLRPVDAVLKPWRHAGPMNFVRVYWDAVPAAEVLGVVQGLCDNAKQDADAACHVVATRGLFNPSWEDDGSFGLFMSGADRIDVITAAVLWAPGGESGRTRAHALVDVRCPPGVAPSAGVKFQLQEGRMAQFLASNGGRPVAVLGKPGGCTQSWYALPAGGVRVD